MPRESTLGLPGDLHAPTGSREWCLAVQEEIRQSVIRLDGDARNAGCWLRIAKEHEAWKALGLLGWESFVQSFGLASDDADRLIGAKAGTVGQVLGKPGRPKKGEEKVGNTKLIGATKPYTMARLRRDAPELAERVEAGELSANAAAIEAGFRKKQISVPVGDVDAAIRRLLKHYASHELIDAIDRVEAQGGLDACFDSESR